MADEKPRNDVFAAVGVLTLLFMILGIVVAVIHLNAYSRPTRLSSVAPKTKVERVDLLGPRGADGNVGGGEGSGPTVPPVPPPAGGTEGP